MPTGLVIGALISTVLPTSCGGIVLVACLVRLAGLLLYGGAV